MWGFDSLKWLPRRIWHPTFPRVDGFSVVEMPSFKRLLLQKIMHVMVQFFTTSVQHGQRSEFFFQSKVLYSSLSSCGTLMAEADTDSPYWTYCINYLPCSSHVLLVYFGLRDAIKILRPPPPIRCQPNEGGREFETFIFIRSSIDTINLMNEHIHKATTCGYIHYACFDRRNCQQ